MIIGSIFPPGTQVGPTGGSGSGVPSADAASPDPPGHASPAADIECWVLVYTDPGTGQRHIIRILWCDDDLAPPPPPPGTGSGGGGGGDGDNDHDVEETPSADFSLECDGLVQRGTWAGCRVTVDEDSGVNLDDYKFTWISTRGTRAEGDGVSTWGGRPLDEITISVTVSGGSDDESEFTDSRKLSVGPRTFPIVQLRATPQSSRDVLSHGAYYYMGDPPTIEHGSGPWEGAATSSGGPHVVGTLLVRADYYSTGPLYQGANQTCAGASGINQYANYWSVNTICGTLDEMIAWRGTVIAHEREHEAGYNSCLGSRNGQRMLADMEAAVGHATYVRNRLADVWSSFQVSLIRAGERAGAAESDVFWLYSGGWRRGYYNTAAESGQHGC